MKKKNPSSIPEFLKHLGDSYDRNTRSAISAALSAIGKHGKGVIPFSNLSIAQVLTDAGVVKAKADEPGVFIPASTDVAVLISKSTVADDGHLAFNLDKVA